MSRMIPVSWPEQIDSSRFFTAADGIMLQFCPLSVIDIPCLFAFNIQKTNLCENDL